MRKITKRSAAIAAAAVIGIGGAGIAWAAWTTDGVGTAAASADTAQAVTISAGSVAGAPLVPGATRTLAFSVANPNDFPVLVKSVTLADATTDNDSFSVEVSGDPNSAGSAADCQGTFGSNGATGKTGIKLTGPPANPNTIVLSTPVEVAAKAEATPVTVTGGVKMTNDSDNACQGKTFELDLKVASASNAS